ncbi:MAG: hypothetical protein FJ012_05935 [Chloroflexi bacterium]|nr:hypothetical protein [Chloroflexota bacterium]
MGCCKTITRDTTLKEWGNLKVWIVGGSYIRGHIDKESQRFFSRLRRADQNDTDTLMDALQCVVWKRTYPLR